MRGEIRVRGPALPPQRPEFPQSGLFSETALPPLGPFPPKPKYRHFFYLWLAIEDVAKLPAFDLSRILGFVLFKKGNRFLNKEFHQWL